MLCPKCENQFSTCERTAGLFLAKLNDLSRQIEAHPIRQSSLDYRKIKLFFSRFFGAVRYVMIPLRRRLTLGRGLRS